MSFSFGVGASCARVDGSDSLLGGSGGEPTLPGFAKEVPALLEDAAFLVEGAMCLKLVICNLAKASSL